MEFWSRQQQQNFGKHLRINSLAFACFFTTDILVLFIRSLTLGAWKFVLDPDAKNISFQFKEDPYTASGPYANNAADAEQLNDSILFVN